MKILKYKAKCNLFMENEDTEEDDLNHLFAKEGKIYTMYKVTPNNYTFTDEEDEEHDLSVDFLNKYFILIE